MAQDKTRKWAVVFLIHAQTPRQHLPQLFVTGVPREADVDEVKAAITRAGYRFREFGIPWANHYVSPEEYWNDEVIGGWNRKSAPEVSWDSLHPIREPMYV